MRNLVLAAVLLLPSVLSACGDAGTSGGRSTPSSSPSISTEQVNCSGGATARVSADLDGNGAPERLFFSPRTNEGCPASLAGLHGTKVFYAEIDGDPQVGKAGLSAVSVPGRRGALVLLLDHHPRGGFQAHLFGYADGKLEELEIGGQPIFPFVATDALSTPVAAACTADGFAVTEARAHQPIGVAPAWDIYRTTYEVDGNTVTKTGETELAENVLTEDLEAKYRNLVNHALFEDCLATG
jgi:hypothetical protein